jgi:predicted ATPase
VLEAASVSYGKATPYFPLVEMLRRYFGIGPGESIEEIQSRVLAHLLELDSALKDTIPPVLSLLGALPEVQETSSEEHGNQQTPLSDLGEVIRRFNSMDPQQRRRDTFDAVKRVLICETHKQPLLIVFEDLHWIDTETEAFLDCLIESLPMTRVLLLLDIAPITAIGGWIKLITRRFA